MPQSTTADRVTASIRNSGKLIFVKVLVVGLFKLLSRYAQKVDLVISTLTPHLLLHISLIYFLGLN